MRAKIFLGKQATDIPHYYTSTGSAVGLDPDKTPLTESHESFDPFVKDTAESAYQILQNERHNLDAHWRQELEKDVAQDPEYAFYYARDILKSRFPLAEPMIAQDPGYAFAYANGVLGKRWPAGPLRDTAESAISQDPGYAYLYAREVLKSRWPEAESVISRDPFYWLDYCRDFGLDPKKYD
jgi:hypothetical protein